MSLKALRAIAFSLASLSACAVSIAADSVAPVVLAKADTSSSIGQFVQALAPASLAMPSDATSAYPSIAEAELIGMGYEAFDVILAEALGVPTAAGYSAVPSRAAVEEVVARTMGGMMP
jgi:hypothetical protein